MSSGLTVVVKRVTKEKKEKRKASAQMYPLNKRKKAERKGFKMAINDRTVLN